MGVYVCVWDRRCVYLCVKSAVKILRKVYKVQSLAAEIFIHAIIE